MTGDLLDQHLAADELGLLCRTAAPTWVCCVTCGRDQLPDGRFRGPSAETNGRACVDAVDDQRPHDLLGEQPGVVGGGLVGGGAVVQLEPLDGVVVAEPGLPPVEHVLAGRPVLHRPRCGLVVAMSLPISATRSAGLRGDPGGLLHRLGLLVQLAAAGPSPG